MNFSRIKKIPRSALVILVIVSLYGFFRSNFFNKVVACTNTENFTLFMERICLLELKKGIDLSFRQFSRQYGDGIEAFFDPLLFFWYGWKNYY